MSKSPRQVAYPFRNRDNSILNNQTRLCIWSLHSLLHALGVINILLLVYTRLIYKHAHTKNAIQKIVDSTVTRLTRSHRTTALVEQLFIQSQQTGTIICKREPFSDYMYNVHRYYTMWLRIIFIKVYTINKTSLIINYYHP